MESVCSVSKLSTESVGSRRELCSHRRRVKTVSSRRRCVHTADATRLDSFVSSASAVCIGLNRSGAVQCVQLNTGKLMHLTCEVVYLPFLTCATRIHYCSTTFAQNWRTVTTPGSVKWVVIHKRWVTEVGTLLLTGAACDRSSDRCAEPVCAGCGQWPEQPGSADQRWAH